MCSDREGAAVARTGKGKVVDRGTRYPKIYIYVPMDVVKDSTFPFKVRRTCPSPSTALGSS